MMLKKTALTLALSLGLVGGAFAANQNVNIGPVVGNDSFGGFHAVQNTFFDSYWFSLATPLYSSGSLISVESATRDIAGLTVQLYKSSVSFDSGLTLATLTSGIPVPYSLVDTLVGSPFAKFGAGSLNAGTYFFAVSGTGTGSLVLDGKGQYSYSVTVDPALPVPEPETYAMLLAGLGLMGTIARRRKSKAA